MKKHGDISCRAPHERAVRRFHREAPYEACYGANFSFASTRDRLAQVSASAFDQLAERAVRGVPPLRIVTGRGIPLQLTDQGIGMRARMQARSSLLPAWPANAPTRTYTNSWQEPSGVAQIQQWVDILPLHRQEIFFNPPASPAAASPSLASPVRLHHNDGWGAQEIGWPSSEEDDEGIKLVSEDAPLAEEPDATEWHTWLKDSSGESAGPPVIRAPWAQISTWPTLMEGFNLESLNRRQLVHWTGNDQAALINCGATTYRGVRFSGLLPFFPEGFQTNLTPFPVIWFARNDFEGNVSGLNHVVKKYPNAKSYHRFVVSVELSHYIHNHTMTTSWVSKNRANEFRKYTEPVHIEHLKETRCYLRRSRNGVTVDPYYSMTNVDVIDAIEPTSTYVHPCVHQP